MKKYKEKTPELYAAKRALAAYFKEHNLDPTDTRLMKDKVHGAHITDLVNKLNKERDKVMVNYPAADRSNNLKLLKMSKEKEKKAKDKKVQEVATENENKKKSTGRTATKYDYPQVKDEKTGKMRDMTSDEKKKYRVEARKKATGDTSAKPKKEKKSDTPVDNKKSKKDKADKKKDKKAKKDED